MTYASPKLTLVLILVLMYYVVAVMYTPAFPQIAEYYNVGNEAVKASMTYYQFGTILVCIVAGFFSDNFGKLNFLRGILILGLAGCLISIFAPTIEMLSFGRSLQGVGAAGALMMSYTMLVDFYPQQKDMIKVMSLMGIIGSLCWAISPSIGGFLSHTFDWRYVFVGMFLLLLIGLIQTERALDSSFNLKNSRNLKEQVQISFNILTNRTFICFASMNPIFFLGYFFGVSILPFYYQNTIGLTETEFGIHSTVIIVFIAIGSYFGRILSNCIGPHKSILFGLLVGLSSGILLFLTEFLYPKSAYIITFSMSLYFLGLGLSFPGSVGLALSEFKQFSSQASALRTLLATISAFIGSFIAQGTSDKSLLNLAIIITLCLIIMLLLLYIGSRSKIDLER